MNTLQKTYYSAIDFITGNKYPFIMPPLQNKMDKVPQLLEWTEEPYGLINGSNISVWFYTDKRGNIVELMEAGHSNSYVCGKATSLFVEAISNLKSFKLELFTAGSLWVKIVGLNNDDQKILKQLRGDLLLLEQKTKLVKVVNEHFDNLLAFRNQINNQHSENCTSRNVVTKFKINTNKSKIGILDYQLYKSCKKELPIQFKIKQQLYKSKTYEELLKLHAISLHNFRIQDIIRRADVYSEWLLTDINELQKLIQDKKKLTEDEWDFNIIPYSGTRDYYTATTTSGKKKKDIMFRAIEDNYQEWIKDFRYNRGTRKKSFDKLVKSVQVWSENTRNKELLNYGTTNFRDRFEDTAPHFIVHDFNWILQMVDILILDYENERDAIPKIWDIFRNIIRNIPDYSTREELIDVYKPELISSLSDLWKRLHYVLQRIVDKHKKILPNSLKKEIPIIFKRLNEKRDAAKRQKRVAFHKNINQTVLLDALIRGWPSFFLRTTELRELYNKWSEEVRELIWKEIHFQLRKINTKILPFVEPNMSFQISQDYEYLYLTPHFGINSERFYCFYHKKIGTPHISLPWSYKTINTNSKKETNSLFMEFWHSVSENDFANSNIVINKLLKINPILTCSKFFNEFWNYFGRIEDENIKPINEFQLALEEIDDIETYNGGYQRLKQFNNNFPNKLVDAPLRLAYFKGQYFERLKLIEEYKDSTNEQKEYFQGLNQLIEENINCKHVAGFINLPQKILTLIETNANINSQVHLNKISNKNSNDILEYIINNSTINELKGNITQRDLNSFALNELLKTHFQLALKKDQDYRNSNIEKIVNSLNSIDDLIWKDFQKSDYFQQAKEMNEELVNDILENKQIKFSYKYTNEYEPYFYLNVADSKMRIVIAISNWHTANMDIKLNEIKPIAKSFSNVIDEIRKQTLGIYDDDKKKVEQLIKSKIKPLSDYPSKEDSYTRLDLLAEAQNLISHFATQGGERYHVSYLSLPLYTPAYMKFVELKFLAEPEYANIIKELSKKQVPLGAVLDNYEIIIDTEIKGAFIPTGIEVVDKKINVFNNENSIIVSIKFQNNDEKTIVHIKQEVEKVAFRTTNLYSQGSSLASRVLKALILPPPKTKLLQRILIENFDAFVYILAYSPARLSPNISNDAFGKKVDSKLLSIFRDIALVTTEQQNDLKRLLNKINNATSIDSFSYQSEKIQEKINDKYGYRFKK